MKFTAGPLVFCFHLAPTLLVLCLLPVLVSLGVWQLGRSQEKQLMLDQQALRADQKKLLLTIDSEDDPDSLRYRRVTVAGAYDTKHQFLLDNQIVAGRAGYYVMTPFILAGLGKAVLVNRGWVPLPRERSDLPVIKIKQNESSIKGRINNFPVVGIKLPGVEIPAEGWPSVIQLVEPEILAEKLGYPLFGFQVELDNQQANGYWRDWKTRVLITPEKHFAYAVQWFGLAITLLVLFIWFSSNKKNK